MFQKRRVAGIIDFRSSWLLPLGLGLAAACGSSERAPTEAALPRSFFAGATGVEQPTLAGLGGLGSKPVAGNGGAAGSSLPNPCADVPEGQLALIDDFEDGNQDALPEVDREAYWFPIKDDEASTGILVPEQEFLGGVAGGAHGSRQAAHLTASGFSVWGAAFAANISHLKDDIRCPFNAHRFSGYRFYARGSGSVFVTLQVPEVIDEEYGGTCRSSAGETCYDAHGLWLTLTPDWQPYSFKWSDFKQRGFGKKALFNPGTIMSIQFSFEKAQLPVDVWLDDVGWDDASPFPAAGAAGSAGTGGSDQLGGASGIGGASGMSGAGGMSGAAQGGGAGQGNAGAGGVSGAAGQGTP